MRLDIAEFRLFASVPRIHTGTLMVHKLWKGLLLTKLEQIDNLTNQIYPDDVLLRQQLFRLEETVLRLNPRISNAILNFLSRIHG